MKNVITILMTTFSLICWGQDFTVHIDPGDFSNSKEVTTIYAKKYNRLFVVWDAPIDTCFVEIDNGTVLDGGRISHSIIPKNIGTATIVVTVKFKKGQIIKKSLTYKVIDYPKLDLQFIDNNLLTNGTIKFQIYSDGKNLTSEFGVGYFEIQILGPEGESIFETPTGGSLQLDLKKYESQFQIQKGQILKISSVRLLWKEYNLPAFIKPCEFKI